MTLSWTKDDLAKLASTDIDCAPVITQAQAVPMSSDIDVWDSWPLADPSGAPVAWRGGELWFALTVDRSDDPETRHHLARIHYFHRQGDRFEHLGATLPEGDMPGSRQWSGSARVDNGEVEMFFTASGRRADTQLTFKQRLFSSKASFWPDREYPFGEWSEARELFQADNHLYRPADENDGVPGKIKAFRDPSHYRGKDGQDYVLFTGSSAQEPGEHDGVIGLARADAKFDFRLLPPLISAVGTNNELERPHIVEHGGLLYLFWSTQRGVFAPGIEAPTGLYGAVAKALGGPWRLLNGHGLVVANPIERPTQGYSWWVLPDLSVASFVDYWGPEDPTVSEIEQRRARFGGTFAPFVQIALDGDRSRLVAS